MTKSWRHGKWVTKSWRHESQMTKLWRHGMTSRDESVTSRDVLERFSVPICPLLLYSLLLLDGVLLWNVFRFLINLPCIFILWPNLGVYVQYANCNAVIFRHSALATHNFYRYILITRSKKSKLCLRAGNLLHRVTGGGRNSVTLLILAKAPAVYPYAR